MVTVKRIHALKRSDVPSLPVNHISGPKSGEEFMKEINVFLIREQVNAYNDFLSRFYWAEDIKPINPPESYSEPFRPISPDEMHCIMSSCRRGRIPWTDPLAKTPGNLIQVSFTCNSKGTTQCVILCNHPDCTYIFIGIARLLPTDSFDRLHGQRLAYYRAVTESEAIALPVGIHFALAS